MNYKQSIQKFLKITFYFLALIGFFALVDFDSLSFKTIVPRLETKIEGSKIAETGVIRNLKNEFEENQISFQGDNQEIINLVNKARKEAGLENVKENEKLRLSAMEKAQHMKDNGYFDHVSPQGLQPWYFAQKQNYNYKTFGENLAEGYFSAQSVHTGWMNSPGHRENILSEKFKEIGVAILEFQQDSPVLSEAHLVEDLPRQTSRDKQKSYLIVQHFGSQLTSQDLITKIVCDKKSKKNCEKAEDDKDDLEGLIEEQKKIIKKAEEDGAGSKDLNRLKENLEDLKDDEDEMEDYLEECDDFLKKCDSFE